MHVVLVVVSILLLASVGEAQVRGVDPAAAVDADRNAIAGAMNIQNPKAAYSFCLAGDQFAKIPVALGDKIVVRSSKGDGCDERGWSADGIHYIDPSGKGGTYVPGSACLPKPESRHIGEIGMLTGAFSRTDVGGSMDLGAWSSVFSNEPLGLGTNYQWTAATDGHLYLIMCDTWTYPGNSGSVRVKIAKH